MDVVLPGTVIRPLPRPKCRLPGTHQLSPRDYRNRWLDRFCVRLRDLRPSMSFPAAAKLAVCAWPEASDLAPEEAAEIYVNE
jgi:hypothetical protein